MTPHFLERKYFFDQKFVRLNFCYNPGILQNIPGINVSFLDAKSCEDETFNKNNLPVTSEMFIINFDNSLQKTRNFIISYLIKKPTRIFILTDENVQEKDLLLEFRPKQIRGKQRPQEYKAIKFERYVYILSFESRSKFCFITNSF